MSTHEDPAGRFSEALRDALEWASDLDAGLTREAAALAEVEAHAMHVDVPAGVRAVVGTGSSAPPAVRVAD